MCINKEIVVLAVHKAVYIVSGLYSVLGIDHQSLGRYKAVSCVLDDRLCVCFGDDISGIHRQLRDEFAVESCGIALCIGRNNYVLSIYGDTVYYLMELVGISAAVKAGLFPLQLCFRVIAAHQ